MAKQTSFALKRPCPNCPFRRNIPGYLRRDRAAQIARDIAEGRMLACHETTAEDPDSDGSEMMETPESQFCAGAMIVMELAEAPTQIMRIGERFGGYDHRKLDMDAPVVGSLVEFVQHHAEAEESDAVEPETCSVCGPGCESPAGYMVNGVAVLPEMQEEGLVHECPSCGEPVCESCSNEAGVCGNCVEVEE